MPLQHRHAYAADIRRGLPTSDINRSKSSHHHLDDGARCCPAQICQVRAGGSLLRGVHTLVHCRYTVLSRSPNPHDLTVLVRPGFVRAACHPPRRSPDQAALSFATLAATSARWCPFITTRFTAPRGARCPNSKLGSRRSRSALVSSAPGGCVAGDVPGSRRRWPRAGTWWRSSTGRCRRRAGGPTPGRVRDRRTRVIATPSAPVGVPFLTGRSRVPAVVLAARDEGGWRCR